MRFLLSSGWRAGAVCLFCAGAAVSQTSSSGPAPTVTMSVQMGGFAGAGPAMGSPFKAVTGKPYSGEQVTERVQTLADGTNISQTMRATKLYRDSEGRTRTEHIMTPPVGAIGSAPMLLTILDPVAGYQYVLN